MLRYRYLDEPKWVSLWSPRRTFDKRNITSSSSYCIFGVLRWLPIMLDRPFPLGSVRLSLIFDWSVPVPLLCVTGRVLWGWNAIPPRFGSSLPLLCLLMRAEFGVKQRKRLVPR